MEEREKCVINGTIMWYYYICLRQVWLMARQIVPDQDKENIDLGRWIHQHSYNRDRHEINLGNIKIDLVHGNKGQVVIGEIKKSSRSIESARMQLLYYLYELEVNYGLEMTGMLFIPEEKKKEEIELDEEGRKEVKTAIAQIKQIQQEDTPPPPQSIRWCSKCAYAEFCWS